jgi:PAS domain S-box-containing protein
MMTSDEVTERVHLLSAGSEAGRMGAWHFDVRNNRLTYSDGLLSLIGIDRNQFDGTPEAVEAFTHPDDIERRRKDRVRDLAVGDWLEHDYRIIRPDGGVRWMWLRGKIVRRPDGTAAEAYGVALDITERKQEEERQQLLLGELRHRMQNTLAQMSVIVERSCASAASVDAVTASIIGRLSAMARAQARSSRGNSTGLRELVEGELAPYRSQTNATVEGPDLVLIPRAAEALSMVFQELATNAVKYGALSTAEGRVAVRWHLTGDSQLNVVWQEEGGPTVAAPKREGFGTYLIHLLLRHDLGGQVEMNLAPAGARCAFQIPLARATDVAAVA